MPLQPGFQPFSRAQLAADGASIRFHADIARQPARQPCISASISAATFHCTMRASLSRFIDSLIFICQRRYAAAYAATGRHYFTPAAIFAFAIAADYRYFDIFFARLFMLPFRH